MRIIATLLLSLALLTSCTGGSTTQLSFKNIEDGRFTMSIFSSWEEVDQADVSTVLRSTEFRMFQNPLRRDGVHSKLTIIAEELANPTTSMSFAESQISKTPLAVLDYIKEQQFETTIGGTPTMVHIYRAKHSSLSPEQLFIQSFVVWEGTESYTITFSTAPSSIGNSTIMDAYVSLLASFQPASNTLK